MEGTFPDVDKGGLRGFDQGWCLSVSTFLDVLL